jgi:hypothetical protein
MNQENAMSIFTIPALRTLGLLALSLGIALPSLAASELVADKSDIRFVSVKNASVAEVHYFKSLSGGIDGGVVNVTIPLVDVETLIPIRNERMQKMLFETELYPRATLTGQVDMEKVMALKSGEYTQMDVSFMLDLHGSSKQLASAVTVARLGDEIHVTTLQPLVLSAADFKLTEGVERLREVAGLSNISTAVPVTAHLVFRR